MAKQYLCFDMDGTLIDSMDCWNNLKYHMCERYFERTGIEIQLTSADADTIEKLGLKAAINYINRTYNTSLDFELDACATLQKFYLNECTVKAGVIEALDTFLADGTKMCVITATPYKYTIEVLQHLGLLKYFSFVLTPNQYKKCKRSKSIFYAACLKFRCLPKNAVLIDDAIYAHETAKKAGLYRVGVYDKYRNDELGKITNINFKDFKELLAYYLKERKL